MPVPKDDRVRVASVKVERGGRVREIRHCWISVNPGGNAVGIWLAPDEEVPHLTVPLSDAIIEWKDPTIPM